MSRCRPGLRLGLGGNRAAPKRALNDEDYSLAVIRDVRETFFDLRDVCERYVRAGKVQRREDVEAAPSAASTAAPARQPARS